MNIDYYKQYEPIFGSWTITRQIGEGSFGKVFEIQRKIPTVRSAISAAGRQGRRKKPPVQVQKGQQ